MIASFAALLAVRKKAHNADAVRGHNYYSGNKKPQIMRHTGVAGVINAMSCGCRICGEQDGFESNFIHAASFTNIESPH